MADPFKTLDAWTDNSTRRRAAQFPNFANLFDAGWWLYSFQFVGMDAVSPQDWGNALTIATNGSMLFARDAARRDGDTGAVEATDGGYERMRPHLTYTTDPGRTPQKHAIYWRASEYGYGLVQQDYDFLRAPDGGTWIHTTYFADRLKECVDQTLAIAKALNRSSGLVRCYANWTKLRGLRIADHAGPVTGTDADGLAEFDVASCDPAGVVASMTGELRRVLDL